jgi:hypothetical protein
MSASLAQHLMQHMMLTPTTKLMKSLSVHIVPYLGILYIQPIQVEGILVHLSFYVFPIWDFDLLIGQPFRRLLYEGQTGKLNIYFGKKLQFLVSISQSLSTKTKSCLESDPLKEFKAASLEFLFDSGLEDDAKFFIEEEADYSEPKPLDEFAEPPRPPIELKPLPAGLRYTFLDDDLESPMIISDKLRSKLCV